jgi:hypothetical protein
MEQLSPMKKVQAATNILGDLTKDAVEVAENIQNGLGSAAGAIQSSAQFVADPAFSQIKKDMIWFNLLKEVVPAIPGGGVDWNKAKRKATVGKAKGRTFLSVVESGFAGATDAFRNLATDSKPSTKYVAALEGINEVVSDMKREIAEGEKSGAYIPPKAGDPMVDHWSDAFAEHYQTAIELCSASKSFPGNAPGGVSSPSQHILSNSPLTAPVPLRQPLRHISPKGYVQVSWCNGRCHQSFAYDTRRANRHSKQLSAVRDAAHRVLHQNGRHPSHHYEAAILDSQT